MMPRLLALVAILTTLACSRRPEPTESAPAETASPEGATVTTPAAEPAKLVRTPTEPDPAQGSFSLEAATRGMEGEGHLVAELRTTEGTITCDLLAKEAPNTVANFVGLARGTRPWWDAREAKWVKRPYFDGTTFHRVIPGFMIQGGDNLGDGSGTVGYEFDDEVSAGLKHDRAGLLCMANRGVNTNSAQFFITDGAAPHLTRMNSFTIFGRCEPLDVIAKIARVPQSGAPSNRPITPVTIEKVEIRKVSGTKG